jgi:Transposase DDE domain
MQERCSIASQDRRIIIICDTTEYNISNHKQRIQNFGGLGMTTDNRSIGFYSHNQLVLDRVTKFHLGWADVHLFNREMNNIPYTRSNSSVPIEEKESYKWLGPSLMTRDQILNNAEHKLYVMDREADIYEVIDKLPSKDTDILIRARHNRTVYNHEGEKIKINDLLNSSEQKGKATIKLTTDNKKRKPRVANCELKYILCEIEISKKVKNKNEYSQRTPAYIIQLKETDSTAPKEETPLNWTLIYSGQITNNAEAIELLECYTSRWQIEECHRLLKTEGFRLESTELENGKSIRKLLILAMIATIKIMQLKSAREGNFECRIEMIFNVEEQEFLKLLNQKYEGESFKQKNPHLEKELAWASWIIARLGGWKGYQSQRPPGTIVYKKGLDKYYNMYDAFKITKDMYKR